MSENDAVIYARYSSDRQRDVSIDQQVKAIQKYADSIGLRIINIYADRAMTGTNDKRPAFQQMISDSSKGAFKYVIVYTLDRFARDRYDSAVYKRQLKLNGVKVLSAMEQINDDPTGILMESLLEGLSEYYSVELSRKIKRGQEDNASKCLVNGGRLPYGYRKSADNHYEIVPEEAEIVKEIFDRVAYGEDQSAIIKDLNSRGMVNGRKQKWSRTSFDKMLSNERYIGTYIYGDYKKEDAIPAIIDKKTFFKIQSRMTTKPHPKGAPNRRKQSDGSVYLLTGKLYCGECLSPMVGESGKSRNGDVYHYYSCRSHKKGTGCQMHAVNRDAIELQIAQELRRIVLNKRTVNWIANCVVTIQEQNRATSDEALLNIQLKSIQQSKQNIMKAIEAGIFTNTTKQRLEELERDESDIEEKLSKIKLSEEVFTKDEIVTFLSMFREGDIKDKHIQEALFNAFLLKAYIFNDHYELSVRFTEREKHIDTPLKKESLVRISGPTLHRIDTIRTIFFDEDRFVVVTRLN